jgi:hypothetical protein
MSTEQTYSGGCHCGRVRFEVTAGLERVIACNCSICSKKAYLLAFVPAAQFRLVSGEETLTDYQFNKKRIHHLFCSVCGIESFSRGTNAEGQPMYSINALCLDDVDKASLNVTHFDGKNR